MKYKFLALSIAIFSIYGCKDTAVEKQKMGGPRTATVTAFDIKETKIDISKDFKAKVEPIMLAEIRPQISGIIVSKEIKDGDFVKKGQTLYKIDDSQYRATYEQNLASLNSAKVDLENAKVKNDRYVELFKEKAISKQEKEDIEVNYKKMKSNYEEKKASLKLSEINLEYTNIKSPIDGFIGISSITQGSLVTTNQNDKINTVTNLNPIYLDINKTSSEFFEMKKYIDKYNYNPTVSLKNIEYKYKGNLVSTDFTVNSNSDSIKIRTKIENPDNTLLPGMFVNVSINYGSEEKAILVPQKSVSFNSKGIPYVFLIKNNEDKKIVELKEIEIDSAVENNWLVKSGLNNGDKVVFDGFDKIKTGDIVNIAKVEE